MNRASKIALIGANPGLAPLAASGGGGDDKFLTVMMWFMVGLLILAVAGFIFALTVGMPAQHAECQRLMEEGVQYLPKRCTR